MGWTGNSSANWEMGWEMRYFKTISGKGWEMGRVKMGEHCCILALLLPLQLAFYHLAEHQSANSVK